LKDQRPWTAPSSFRSAGSPRIIEPGPGAAQYPERPRRDRARTRSGNVRNTVYATRYQLDDDGFLSPNQRITGGKLVGEVIALMSNRA